MDGPPQPRTREITYCPSGQTQTFSATMKNSIIISILVVSVHDKFPESLGLLLQSFQNILTNFEHVLLHFYIYPFTHQIHILYLLIHSFIHQIYVYFFFFFGSTFQELQVLFNGTHRLTRETEKVV